MEAEVYTVGYANRSIEQFIALLRDNSITAIADVRSQPYSKFNSEFTSDSLRAILKKAEIGYVFLGKELGARAAGDQYYVAGKVQYDLIAARPSFQAGLDRIDKGRKDHRIALMCAEMDPLDCHRCILVGRHLAGRGIPILHILETDTVERHESTLRRLVQLLRIQDAWKTQNDEEDFLMAYQIQGERIAFHQAPVEIPQYELWAQGSSQ